MRQVLAAPAPPAIEPDDHCFAPYECPFWDHCTKDKPARWIYHLPGSRHTFHDLTTLGIQTIDDIPPGYSLQLVQQRVKDNVGVDRPGAPCRAGHGQVPGPPSGLRDAGVRHPALSQHAALPGHPVPVVKPHRVRGRAAPPRGLPEQKVPDAFWLVTDGFYERPISHFGRCIGAGSYVLGNRSANHTGGPDGGDGFRSHPPDGPIARNWNRPSGHSTG